MHRGGVQVAATDRQGSGGHANVHRAVVVAGEPEAVEDRLGGVVETTEVEDVPREDAGVPHDVSQHALLVVEADLFRERVGVLPQPARRLEEGAPSLERQADQVPIRRKSRPAHAFARMPRVGVVALQTSLQLGAMGEAHRSG